MTKWKSEFDLESKWGSGFPYCGYLEGGGQVPEDRRQRTEDGGRRLGLGFWRENKKRISNIEQGMSNDEVEFGV